MLIMKSYMAKISAIVLFLVFHCGVWCYGEGDMDVAPMEKAEREALYSTIQGFVGTSWNGSDLYPDPCGWTPIQGVSCDIFGGLWYVTGLSIGPLQDNSLSCTKNVVFSRQLFELRHLKSLSFFSCFVPSHPVTISAIEWERLAGSLESLEFRSNPGLHGQIPSSLGNLTKLESLVLLENGVIGDFPGSIGRLVKLKRLVLAGNGLTGHIPDCFGALSSLLILDLSRNNLSGPLTFTLGGLTSLLKLDLSSNQLDGKLPNELGYLKNLTLLDIRNNKISGGLTRSLQDMYSLEEMVFSNNPIGGVLSSLNWQNLQNLVVLDVSNTSLTGVIPDSMLSLKKLRYLGLHNNHLTGILSTKLATLPCISALYLNGNNLTGVLNFPEWFYRKMGRRFEAWNNPSLCYSSDSVSRSQSPYGVRPCQDDIKLLELNSETKLADGDWHNNSYFTASSGSSKHAVGGFRWNVLLEISMLILTLSWNLWKNSPI